MGYPHPFEPQGRPLTAAEADDLAREVLEAARSRLRAQGPLHVATPRTRRESRRLPLGVALRLNPEHFAIAGLLCASCLAARWQVFTHFA